MVVTAFAIQKSCFVVSGMQVGSKQLASDWHTSSICNIILYHIYIYIYICVCVCVCMCVCVCEFVDANNINFEVV